MTTRTKLFAAAAALGVLVLALSRGDEPSERLGALRVDPMATYAPPGGDLVDTDAQNEGASLGEPVPARYTRLFQLGTGGTRALADARSAAIAAGWKRLGGPASETFVGTKRVPSGRIELTLVLVEDSRLLPDGVKPPALSVSLHHLGP